MAKKSLRVKIHLKCKKCEEQNYTTARHRDMKEKLMLRKYCGRCRQHTEHIEVKKMK